MRGWVSLGRRLFRRRDRSTHLALGSPKLRIELDEVHPALRLAGGRVDLVEPAVEELDHLRDPHEVRVALRSHLEDRLEQERVSAEPGGRLGEEAVELNLARLGLALDLVDEADKVRVVELLLFKLVLAVRLVAAIVDKRLEEGHAVEKDVADRLDDGLRALALGQLVGERRVVGEDRRNVPEDLGRKRLAPLGRLDDIVCPERLNPKLFGGKEEGGSGRV